MPKKKFSAQEVKEICETYQRNVSMSEIAKIFGCGTIKPIKRVLLAAGVKLRTNDEAIRKYAANYNYFDEIDTPNKAYILGLLYADGCNVMNDTKCVYRWILYLQERDSHILEDIKSEIEYTGSVKKLSRVKNGVKRNYALLWVCNHHMCSALAEHGVTPQKTRNIVFPSWLKRPLIRHFVRGLLDGDGCIRENGFVTISGTKLLVDELLRILTAECDVHPSVYTHNNAIKTCDCNIKTTEAEKFLDWVYADSELKLQRKYDRYVKRFKTQS